MLDTCPERCIIKVLMVKGLVADNPPFFTPVAISKRLNVKSGGMLYKGK